MKKFIFVKTSQNHSRMHDRFIDRSKQSLGVEVISVDLQEWLDSAFCQMLLGRNLGLLALSVLGRFVRKYRHYYRFIFLKPLRSRVLRFLRDQGASVIVISDNYCSYIHMLLVCVARELGIKIVCVPFVNQDYDDILQSRINHQGVRNFSQGFWANRIVRSNPEWLAEFKGSKVLWAHPLEILAIKRLGNPPRNPEQGVADYLDAVFLSGETAKERFLSYGVSGENLHVIGDIIYDYVVVGREKNASPSHPVVLFSICPDLKRNSVYGDYKAYIESYIEMMKGLHKLGVEVWVSLHPSVSPSVKSSFDGEGLFFCDGDVSRFIGLADLYVSSYSSTILIAAALGVPVIDHDIYELGYVGNSRLDEVQVVQSPDDFRHVMDEVVESLGCGDWGNVKVKNSLFDGRVFDRFLEFFEEEF